MCLFSFSNGDNNGDNNGVLFEEEALSIMVDFATGDFPGNISFSKESSVIFFSGTGDVAYLIGDFISLSFLKVFTSFSNANLDFSI